MVDFAGWEIPQELFEYILWRATDSHSIAGLSAVCLVNRYWAGICRQRLHSKLVLRSLADLQTFCALVDSTPPSLPPIVELAYTVYCTVRDDDLPWLHLVQDRVVARMLQPRYPVEVEFRSSAMPAPLMDDDPPQQHGRRAGPLHPNLPRSLPRHFNAIRFLTLHGPTQFRDASQLCRLLHSLKDLTLFTLRGDIVWTRTLPDEDAFFPFALCGSVEEAIMSHTSVDDAFNPCWMLPAFVRASSQTARAEDKQTWPANYPLHRDDYHAILKVVKRLASIREDEGPTDLSISRFHMGTRERMYPDCLSLLYLTSLILFLTNT